MDTSGKIGQASLRPRGSRFVVGQPVRIIGGVFRGYLPGAGAEIATGATVRFGVRWHPFGWQELVFPTELIEPAELSPEQLALVHKVETIER